MIRKIQKPTERYIRFFTRRAENGRYQIKIIYFIDKGNPINDVEVQYEKTIYCEPKDLATIEARIKKKIDKTQEVLEKAYYSIGASEQNVLMLVNEKMR